jgi:2-succinyl-6-hydroxy-2,4-cyclohexadiene-1-carboxylate synthase
VDGFAETLTRLEPYVPVGWVIIGYSQGARVAMALASRAQSQLSGLVLESGLPGIRQRHARAVRRRADHLLARSIQRRGVERFIAEWESSPLFAGLTTLPPLQKARLHERRRAHSAEGLAGALLCLGQGVQPNLWPVLPRLRVPTLLLSGARDRKYTEIACQMSGELPLAWRRTFDGVGHAPHLECPELYAQELTSFFEALNFDPSVAVPR